MDSPLWRLSAGELAIRLGRRETTAVAILDSVLARLTEVNDSLNAVVTLNPNARGEAAESDRRILRGEARSALEGVPATIKDNLLARGMQATWGSRLHAGELPLRDELAVQRLRESGAVVVGKTNCPEFTVEGYTSNTLFGTTRNPWNTALTPGGSSGGAVAAVAAGIGPVSLGTDGGGSIRRPAGLTGLVGFKPSIGAIPRRGGFPRVLLDMEVVGPMCRTVADARLVFDVLRKGGSCPQRTGNGGPQAGGAPLKVLYVPRFGDAPVEAEIESSVTDALAVFSALGHQVESGTLPFSIEAVTQAWPTIGQVGVARLLKECGADPASVGAVAQTMANAGEQIDAVAFASIVEMIELFRTEAGEAFTHFDVIATPTNAAFPWPAEEPWPTVIDGQQVGPRGHALYSGWVNACGHPAISLPCGPAASGLPIGVQLIGGFGKDDQLLDVGEAYESAAPWAERWPSLP
jgi:aspartyl-tRNA(Asn)/glutamyl-tRNA(Gln) amidotransferase subunit A